MLKLFIIITIMIFASQCTMIRNCDELYVLEESKTNCKLEQETGWKQIEKSSKPW